jgi:hypothetical protein
MQGDIKNEKERIYENNETGTKVGAMESDEHAAYN